MFSIIRPDYILVQTEHRSNTCLKTTNLLDKYMTYEFPYPYFNTHIYNLGDF
jgi:hypothetical protein